MWGGGRGGYVDSVGCMDPELGLLTPEALADYSQYKRGTVKKVMTKT